MEIHGFAFYLFFSDFSYVGRLFVKASSKPLEILTKLNEFAGFSPDEDIELFGVSVSYSLAAKFSDSSIPAALSFFSFLITFHTQEVKLEPNVMLKRIPLELNFLEFRDIEVFDIHNQKYFCRPYSLFHLGFISQQ